MRLAVSVYPDRPNENDCSIALMVSCNGFNYFIAGDLTEVVEDRIARKAAAGPAPPYARSPAATSETAPLAEFGGCGAQ